ncbi:ATP-binding protein [Methylomonas methanica]|uniref:histidine kinase n=1 Tax=Methylomonas methanica (strain DSM 25384 / MC09) TaxID=857087 RepID=F9ZVX0_METMM|nr:ATP-binding protein [Methylomonas methanica]AEG00774.1 multi-sensor signal transduction histidine kinase [Methylomonas methanica MC09]
MLLNESQQWDWIYNLYQLGQSDAFEEGSNQIFEKMLRHIVDGFRAETGSLVLYQGEDGNRLTIVAAIGLPEKCIGGTISNGSGVIGWVLANQQALLIKGDISNDTRFHGYTAKPNARIPVASLCWPLQIGQRLIGALSVNSFNDESNYTGVDLDHGQKLANPITLVIDNIRLHADQRKRIQQLANTNERYINTNRQLVDAHKQLAESEKRLNDILNSLDSVVWSMEPGTMKLLYLNKAANEVSGRPVEDFFNDPRLWLKIMDPSDRKQVEASLDNLTTNSIQKLIYRIRRPDGELRWLFHRMCAVCDDAGSPIRIDGITVDITQHKHAEDLLKQRNQELQSALDTIQEVQRQLVQSEKLSSIGQLAAGVAHEINNPIGYINSNLTSLKTYVEDLLALVEMYEKTEIGCADGEQLRQIQDFKQQIDLVFLKTDVLDLLDESHEGASRVKKIVQDLKDFSHAGGADEWQWANLHDCLDSTLNIVNNEVKYKARVVKAYGNIPRAWCLPHQLNQVFMNLLVNAAHAIEKEGTITVRTGTENGSLWVEVSDTGQGISPEHANKIFDPFFTTKPVGKGTGLGLSVSYSIVKKHQGEIKVDSRIGEGTTFRVVLPTKEQPVDV